MLHESGTGGAPKYGVVSQFPVNGTVSNPLADLSIARTVADTSAVGYYKTQLGNGITVELAGTNHAGFYQYTFPSGNASVVVDVSHVLPSFRGLGWGQNYAGGGFVIFEDGHYEGNGTYNNGWNRGKPRACAVGAGRSILTTAHSTELEHLLLRQIQHDRHEQQDLLRNRHHTLPVWRTDICQWDRATWGCVHIQRDFSLVKGRRLVHFVCKGL